MYIFISDKLACNWIKNVEWCLTVYELMLYIYIYIFNVTIKSNSLLAANYIFNNIIALEIQKKKNCIYYLWTDQSIRREKVYIETVRLIWTRHTEHDESNSVILLILNVLKDQCNRITVFLWWSDCVCAVYTKCIFIQIPRNHIVIFFHDIACCMWVCNRGDQGSF